MEVAESPSPAVLLDRRPGRRHLEDGRLLDLQSDYELRVARQRARKTIESQVRTRVA